MKLVYSLLFALSFSAFSQTKTIAHKSHSGSMASFTVRGFDSFGLPPMTIDSIIWVNDTTVVQISSIGGNWHVQKDTFVNHPFLSNKDLTVDSLKNYYYGDKTEFINFETKSSCSADLPISITSVSQDLQVERALDVSVDTLQNDSLAKPKEKIKSRNELKQDALPTLPNDDNENGITPFQLFVGIAFGLAFLLFIVLNRKTQKISF